MHATGAALQGLAPGTVLLAADGPRLTAFGPLGAAASAEAGPEDRLSVRLGYLTPEQIAGEEVSAASDLFVLGLLLAYAATGATPFTEGPAEGASRRIAEDEPELDCVPQELRELIASCLAKDPAERPSAGTVAAELALEGAAGLARGGWLPEPLAAAVADQEARVRALEVPAAGARRCPVRTGARYGRDAWYGRGARCGWDVRCGGGARCGDRRARGHRGGPGHHPVPEHRAAPAPQRHSDDPARAPSGGRRSPAARPRPDRTASARRARCFRRAQSPRCARWRTAARSPVRRAAAPYAAPGSVSPAGPPHGGPTPYPAAALPAGAGGAGAGGGGPMVSLPLPPAPAPAPDPGASRRTLLTIAAAAVGGLVVGGGAMAALGSGETAAATDDKPARSPAARSPARRPSRAGPTRTRPPRRLR